MASFNLQQPFDLKVNLSEKEQNKEWIKGSFETTFLFWFFVIRNFCFEKKTRAKLSGLKCKIVKEFFDWGKLTTVLSVFCWIEIGFGWRTRLLNPEQLWFSFSFGASCCVKNTACCWPTDFNYDFLPPSPFQQSIGLKMCLYMLNKPHSKPRKIVSRNC